MPKFIAVNAFPATVRIGGGPKFPGQIADLRTWLTDDSRRDSEALLFTAEDTPAVSENQVRGPKGGEHPAWHDLRDALRTDARSAGRTLAFRFAEVMVTDDESGETEAVLGLAVRYTGPVQGRHLSAISAA